MGLTNYDKSFYKTILIIMALVGSTIVVLFFPIFETPFCPDTGCTETNIQRSIYEIWQMSRVDSGF